MENPISPKGFQQYGGKARSNTYHPAVNEMFYNMGQEILWRVKQAFADGFIAAHQKPDAIGVEFDQEKLNDALNKHFLDNDYLDQFCEQISYE